MLEGIDPAAVPPRLVVERKGGGGGGKDGGKGNENKQGDNDDDGLLARLAKRRRRALFPSSSSSSSASRQSRPRTVVHVYHGAAAWAAGQLEGELRAGAWGFVPAATAADVLDGSPEDLWRSLVSSGRLTWLARRLY